MSTLMEVMTKNIKTASGDTTVADAARRMRDERMGSLLVEDQGDLVGIVTDTDIVRRAVAEKKDLTNLTLANIMTTPLASIESMMSVHDAQDMMADFGIRHLVVRAAGQIVGLVSARDLLVYYQSVSEPKIAQD